MKSSLIAFAAGLLLTSCSKQPSDVPRMSAPKAPLATRPAAQRPTINPKSSEAAVELVQAFARLIDQRKFDAAYMLLGANAPARSEFDQNFASCSNLAVRVGDAGDQDGAAGSIYLLVPVSVSGDFKGRQSTRSATVVLRRVNDVPGSTEAQRRWHIERVDWSR